MRQICSAFYDGYAVIAPSKSPPNQQRRRILHPGQGDSTPRFGGLPQKKVGFLEGESSPELECTGQIPIIIRIHLHIYTSFYHHSPALSIFFPLTSSKSPRLACRSADASRRFPRYFWSKKVPLTPEMKKRLQNGQTVELQVASRAMTEHGNTQPSRDPMLRLGMVGNGADGAGVSVFFGGGRTWVGKVDVSRHSNVQVAIKLDGAM